ncbi:MAG: threonine/serine dehydratase [Pseudomonadota bacterium]
MVNSAVSLDTVRAAADLLQSHIRHTPMLDACHARMSLPHPCRLHLKLEQLQLTGSFKIRGATHKLLRLSQRQRQNGIVAASGGNHGRAVAYLGWKHSIPTTIFLPCTTPREKIEAIEHWKVNVEFAGENLNAANKISRDYAEKNNQGFIHPYANPEVISGQGTLALEVLQDCASVDVIVVPIGGGGLISGMAVAAKALRPNLKIIGVEPEGCPTLYNSLRAGHVVAVPEITTEVGTLAIQQTTDVNFNLVHNHVDDVVLVSDQDMHNASRWLWQEFGIAAELSGAASVASLLAKKIQVDPCVQICAVISGMGADGINSGEPL